MNENYYHKLGLIGEIITATTHRIEHMHAVAEALTFIAEARREFESANQPKAEEAAEAGPASENLGSDNSNKVRKQKQRRAK